MRLKSLEIKGFKSFANETTIHFNEDVIGVVGPNGSGKSNIVDAVRWVLGEQKSKELRLDQMSNVIFNGTKKRKPSGAASVSLTFENTKNLLPTEYSQVTITRILYRTGESEYRLNGVPCRLKDITSLFLDTGIGSNSYAIIALGMVDDILSDKDNSRRRMFEQAAGVSKYKIRKNETLGKLEATTADLDRVEDLLFEISGNLQVLEKQAKRAKKYFELRDGYRELSINLAVLKVSNFKIKRVEIETQLQKEEDLYRGCEVQIAQLEAQLEADRKANLDNEIALSERQRELNRLIGSIREMENDRKMEEQKSQFLLQNKTKLENDIISLTAKTEQLEEDIEYYRSEFNQEKRLEAIMEEELEAARLSLQQKQDSHGNLKTGLDSILQNQQRLEKTILELEKQKAISQNQAGSQQQEVKRLTDALQQRRQENEGLHEKLAALQLEESNRRNLLETLEQNENQRLLDLEELQNQLDTLQQSLQKGNRDLDAKRNEFKLTKSMVDSLEGFPESIRFLRQSKSWKNDAPLLSDLLFVKEEYRTAIENFLEPFLGFYVVDNSAQAATAIDLLTKAQKGKAHFFLQDRLLDYPVGNPVAQAGLVPAVDLVETEAAFLGLKKYLLEGVYMLDSDEMPADLAPEVKVVLSKSGQIARGKYTLSGGSIGLFEGKRIGRKKNLEILEAEIKKLEKETQLLAETQLGLKSSLDALKGRNYREKVQQEQKQLNQIIQEKAKLAANLDSLVAFEKDTTTRITQLELHLQGLTEGMGHLEQDLERQSNELIKLRAQIAQSDVEFRQAAEALSLNSSLFNEKNVAFIRQQNKVTSLQRDLSYREKQMQEAKQTIQSDKTGIEKAESELSQLHDHIQTLQTQLTQAYDDKKQREKLLTEAEQSYFKARGAINEQEDELRKVNKKRQDAQIIVNALREKYNDLKYEISSIAQRLRIEFEVDVNEVINTRPKPAESQEELQIQMERVKNRLDNYGEINPMAVTAYDEMNDRFEKITQQRNDILEAKESLRKTMEEIETTATTQFLESFEQVRANFIEVFRSLFTQDDNCDLLLLDPENPLESKIEVVAKPKGKRPQTISQLSGGEKTLTATALLFALYLLKPAPFCIFDEVDAPLDDANITKFNRIIKKFSKDSQFIIVTHNKLTMAAVDIIYGVYMAEQGVSGVSQVDFRSFEHSTVFEVSKN